MKKQPGSKREAGVDVAINYKSVDDLESAIADACPDGIDVYFENVGGDHLVAALNLMNLFGRIALCGMIAMYNEPIPGPPNLAVAIGRQLRIQGFIVSSYWDLYPQFLKEMGEMDFKGKTEMEGDSSARSGAGARCIPWTIQGGKFRQNDR